MCRLRPEAGSRLCQAVGSPSRQSRHLGFWQLTAAQASYFPSPSRGSGRRLWVAENDYIVLEKSSNIFFSIKILPHWQSLLPHCYLMTSRSGRVSKPAPVLADPSNVAKPSTSHRAAALAVITERQAAASAAANDHSPHITPPPETLITTPAVDKRPGRLSASGWQWIWSSRSSWWSDVTKIN